jgi:dipeptidyl aminopeptidase/acylaminoacyl peptidase
MAMHSRRGVILCLAVAGVLVGSAISAAAVRSGLPREYLVSALVSSHGKSRFVVEVVSSGGRVIRVVEGAGSGGNARWSPDGRMIAWLGPTGLDVESSNGRARRLLIARSKTCAVECITMTFAWSRDSKSIVVGGAGKETNHLVKVDVATGAVTDIAPVYRYTQYYVIGFSPNGRDLAFARDSGLAGTGSCCKSWLVVARADGSGERRLFSFADPIHDGPEQSSWSPDSNSIAFAEDGRDPHDPPLAVVNVASGRVRSFRGLNNADSPPVWSPDSQQFTIVRLGAGSPPSHAVSSLSLTSGQAATIGSGVLPIAWYPDGTITTVDGTHSVRAINTVTGAERTLFVLPRNFEILSADPAHS